jgi:hypothetical protein
MEGAGAFRLGGGLREVDEGEAKNGGGANEQMRIFRCDSGEQFWGQSRPIGGC